jgi:O-antigen/teichoic acid export membrane protein
MIGERAARGTLCSFADMGGAQAVGFLVFLFLARLIAPADYGVFAIVLFFMAFAHALLMFGLPEALVQRSGIDEDHRSTAFWSNMLLGLFLAASYFAAARWIAAFYRMPLLVPVMRWMSVCCVLNAAASIHLAVLRRDINIMIFPVRTILGFRVGGVVAVAMAYRGFGIWALVANQIGIWGTAVVVVWLYSSWRPRFRFSVAAFKDLFSYAFFNTASTVIINADTRIDSLIVGAFFSAETLGYYAFAQRIFHSLGSAILSPISFISLPVLSRAADDLRRYNYVYVKVLLVSSVLWVPACLGVGAIAGDMVPAVFGAKWLPAVPIIVALSLTAFSGALCDATIYALGALGNPRLMTALAILQMALTVVICTTAAQFDVVIVAFAWSFMTAIMVPANLGMIWRISGLRAGDYLPGFFKIVAAGMVMLAAIWVTRQFTRNFVIETATGGLAYLGTMIALAPDFLRDLVLRLVRASALVEIPRRTVGRNLETSAGRDEVVRASSATVRTKSRKRGRPRKAGGG